MDISSLKELDTNNIEYVMVGDYWYRIDPGQIQYSKILESVIIQLRPAGTLIVDPDAIKALCTVLPIVCFKNAFVESQ